MSNARLTYRNCMLRIHYHRYNTIPNVFPGFVARKSGGPDLFEQIRRGHITRIYDVNVTQIDDVYGIGIWFCELKEQP